MPESAGRPSFTRSSMKKVGLVLYGVLIAVLGFLAAPQMEYRMFMALWNLGWRDQPPAMCSIATDAWTGWQVAVCLRPMRGVDEPDTFLVGN